MSSESLQSGTVYPSLSDIREVSLAIPTAVAEDVYTSGRADSPMPKDITKFLRDAMYVPSYDSSHSTDHC